MLNGGSPVAVVLSADGAAAFQAPAPTADDPDTVIVITKI
jgi:hypothetical protein